MKKTFGLILMVMIVMCAVRVSYAGDPPDQTHTLGGPASVCANAFAGKGADHTTGHTMEIVPGKAPTCEDTGLTDGVRCSVCGEVLAAQEIIPALEHKINVIDEKPATCEEDGLMYGITCLVCGKVLLEQEVIPALGHTVDVIPGKAASCEEAGLTDGEKCSVCGKELKAQKVIPANGHTAEVLPGKAATCEQAGLSEGMKCSVCGKVIVEREVIPALGHDYVQKPPASLTRTEHECWRCGKKVYTDKKNSIKNFYGSILINANDKYVDYAASVDPKIDACLVITAVLAPEAYGWTSEIGLYLTGELIKEIKSDGFASITYVNNNAALTFTLDGIGDSRFKTEEALLLYAFITDPKAAGCLVKVEAITENSRIPAAAFAPMDLRLSGERIRVTEAGNYTVE